ncbi:ATP synthase subunit alpha 2 [Geobacter sp. OR-1]|nr:ATP synthase subunit alpha 2 [Geobacter sp. OR-1]
MVVAVGDGVAWIRCLPSAALDDVIALEDGSRALVFHLGKELVGAILLKQTDRLTAGTGALLSGARPTVPVGDPLLGRVVDPLGHPLDGLPAPVNCTRREIFGPSPSILARTFVNAPLYSGTTMIDTMIPIGKGQRQLIIGGSSTGKSSLALDAIISQHGSGVHCIYVLIGQKRSKAVNIVETLRTTGALAHTSVVVAEAFELPGLKYLAPFAGCAIAEEWMKQGKDTLIVYDDLSLHAQTYREISLLLRRPPGREAYPGDIFYLHARLLERSTVLDASHGGGSMTALPIIEIQQGELAAYIPTNLISITDGQIYLDQELFAAGFLPAIDITRSVSRIGGKAQHQRVKEDVGRMKLDYLQFLELEVFTRFGARLEASVEARIRRGKVLRELLRQERRAPLPVEYQLTWLIAFNEGLLDGKTPEEIPYLMKRLRAAAKEGGCALESSRERWRELVMEALADHGGADGRAA